MDLSEFAGADFETRSVLANGRGDNDASQTSYFFPPGRSAPVKVPKIYAYLNKILICLHGARSLWAGLGYLY